LNDIHDLGEAIELAKSKCKKRGWQSVNDFFESCTYRDDYTVTPVLVCTPGDVAAAVGPAVAAAVAAAVGPAVAASIAPLQAQFGNLRRGNLNKATIRAVRSGAVAAAAQPLLSFMKVGKQTSD